MPHILVVDDDDAIRFLLRAFLEAAGHEVREAADGDEALRALADAPADLVLCDMFMPRRDGLETLRELARSHPGLPVVAMSGGARQGLLDVLPFADRLGAVDVLAKPFDRQTVLEAVSRGLAGQPLPAEAG